MYTQPPHECICPEHVIAQPTQLWDHCQMFHIQLTSASFACSPCHVLNLYLLTHVAGAAGKAHRYAEAFAAVMAVVL